MKIKQIIIRDDHDQDYYFTVGKNGVSEIIEHTAKCEGDKFCYDVITETEVIRLFQFHSVIFEK